ncbi:MAG: alpha/beta fold hydrolase [Caulobacter sp.]|nr:alpha/beta fold hydrolase [Caulobacter sp.]
MVRGFALLFCLLLAACGPDGGSAPFTDSRPPPSLSPRFFPPEGWAWGLVQAGDFPAQRYGVASPPTGVDAHLLILPGYGESAEAWFETVSDFNRRGYTVWVLEGAGQGGSGRFGVRRDNGHIPGTAPDLLAVRAMLRVVIPEDGKPVFLLGSQDGALIALLAGRDLARPGGVVASAPSALASLSPVGEAMGRLGLKGFRQPGDPGWSQAHPYRTGAPGRDRFRNTVQQAWAQANPDLRMGAPSVGRRLAMNEARAQAETALPGITAPVLLISAAEPLNAACRQAVACEIGPGPPGAVGPYSQLEADGPRGAWLAMIDKFVRRHAASGEPAANPLPDHGR